MSIQHPVREKSATNQSTHMELRRSRRQAPGREWCHGHAGARHMNALCKASQPHVQAAKRVTVTLMHGLRDAGPRIPAASILADREQNLSHLAEWLSAAD